MASFCPECLRRSWLVSQLGQHLDHYRFDAVRLSGLLALDDFDLIREVGRADEPELRSRYAAFDPAWVQSSVGVDRICRHDPRYPAGLEAVPGPPAVLNCAGRLSLADLVQRPCVAIIGSRKASPAAIEAAGAIATRLATSGVVVLSGLSRGVNAAAHRAALKAGGPTFGVMPCGLDVPYPSRDGELYEQLLSEGLLVSEVALTYRPRSWCFPARTRIIAGLATATIVVDARRRDGFLAVASSTQALGRPVGAVTAVPEDDRGAEGIHRLLEQGATPITSPDDVLLLLTGGPPEAQRDPTPIVIPTPSSTEPAAPMPGSAPQSQAPPRFGLNLPELTTASSGPAPGPADMADTEVMPTFPPMPPSDMASLNPQADAPALLSGDLDPELQALLDAVRSGRDSVTALTEDGGDLDATLTGLATLELLGHLHRTGDGRYRTSFSVRQTLTRFR